MRSKAKQCKAKQSKEKQSKTKQNKPKQSNACAGRVPNPLGRYIYIFSYAPGFLGMSPFRKGSPKPGFGHGGDPPPSQGGRRLTYIPPQQRIFHCSFWAEAQYISIHIHTMFPHIQRTRVLDIICCCRQQIKKRISPQGKLDANLKDAGGRLERVVWGWTPLPMAVKST